MRSALLPPYSYHKVTPLHAAAAHRTISYWGSDWCLDAQFIKTARLWAELDALRADADHPSNFAAGIHGCNVGV